jgi:Flp pilus assembly protein TadD
MGDQARAEEQYGAVEFIAEVSGPQANVANRELALFQASHGRDTANAVRLAEAELETRKDIYGYDALAWALYNDGHPEAALEPARAALSLGTRDPRLLYHAGMIGIAVGSEVAGRALLRDALALNPAFDPLGVDLARETLGG